MRITLPNIVYTVLQLLKQNGYEAYFVGGRVRDILYAQMTNQSIPQKQNQQKKSVEADYDITTSALPDQIKAVFRQYKQIYTGEKHGTIAIRFKSKIIDITTYRTEGAYTDGRHPDTVDFVSSIEDDLARRDITINAIAVDSSGEIFDLFDGITDLQNGVIRSVGDPQARFQEDSLRLLRAIRFAVKFDFQIEQKTFNAIQFLAHTLLTTAISKERIYTELEEIFSTNPRKGFHLLWSTGLLEYTFVNVNATLKLLEPKWVQAVEEVLQQFAEDYSAIWITLFAPIMLQETYLSEHDLQKILSEYKGLNKRTRGIILHSILNIPQTKLLIESSPLLGDIIDWIDGFRMKYYHDKVQWDRIANNVVKVVYLLLSKIGNDHQSSYEQIIANIAKYQKQIDNNEMQINGNNAKQMGATGISIKWLLTFWRIMYYRDPKTEPQKYRDAAQIFSLNSNLYLPDFLEWLVGSSQISKYTETYLFDVLTLIDNLLIFFGGSIQMFGAYPTRLATMVSKYTHKQKGLSYTVNLEQKNNSLMIILKKNK